MSIKNNPNIVKGAFESVEINDHIDIIAKTEGTKYNHPSVSIMDKAPIKVKAFYHIDKENSTASAGNMGANEFIGDRSPVKYIKIHGFIMYGFIEDLRKRDRNNVTGYQNIKRGASYIIGGVFEPLENSFFTVTMDNGDYLYQITSVEPIQDKDKPIYRITHMPYISDEHEKYKTIDKQVSCERVYVPENIGTEWDVLMDLSLYNSVMLRVNACKHLQEAYIKAFYDEDSNTVTCKDRKNLNARYYSDLIVEFFNRSRCLSSEERNIIIQLYHEIKPHDGFIYDFDDTIYGKLLNGDELEEDEQMEFSIRKYIKGENTMSFFDKFDYEVHNISYDLDRIDMAAELDDKSLYVRTIPYNQASLFKELVNVSMKVSDLDRTLIMKHRIRPYDLDAYMRIPLVIYLLINASEGDAAHRYNHFIADLLKAI